MQHELKILPEYFTAIMFGKKNFEIRKNDRDFKVGDVLKLMEYAGGKYTGSFIRREIVYIYHGDGNYGLEKGYCVLGLSEHE